MTGIPRDTIHAFKNVGATAGRLRYVFSPALNMEAVFRAFFDAQRTAELTEEAMREIAAAHGQRFVGPPL